MRHLTHGVSVWLCGRHATDAYAVRERGQVFVGRLASVWAAAGALTRQRMRALERHLDRVSGDGATREKPGSYSWPKLRREAERRFAGGEAPDAVIADLRARYPDGPALLPSVRTMRRWFAEGRWLDLRLGDHVPADGGRPAARPRPSLGQIIGGILWYPSIPFAELYVNGAWRGPP